MCIVSIHLVIYRRIVAGWKKTTEDRSLGIPLYSYFVNQFQIEPPEMDEVVDQFPSITYSTMHLDCKRLIERALREGHLPSEQKVK